MEVYLNENHLFENLVVTTVSSEPPGVTTSMQQLLLLTAKIQLKKPAHGFVRPSEESNNSSSWRREFVDKLETTSSAFQRSQGGIEEGYQSAPKWELPTGRYHLCIHLEVPFCSSCEGNCASAPVMVKVHGFLADMLKELDFEKMIKMKLQIGIHSYNKITRRMGYSKLLFADIPLSSNDVQVASGSTGPPCIRKRKYFQAKLGGDDLALTLFKNHSDSSIGGVINVILYRDGAPEIGGPAKARISQEILSNPSHSDFTIVASNGKGFECNKTILAAHSPVYAAMFETPMRESRTKRVKISDMSEEAVGAFLAYLYFWDVKAPQDNAMVAVELLKAGHKYDIQHLEQDMKELIYRKPVKWFGVEATLLLYLFAKELEAHDDLQKKAVDVLELKASSMTPVTFLESVREMKEMIPPEVGFELFQLVAEKATVAARINT